MPWRLCRPCSCRSSCSIECELGRALSTAVLQLTQRRPRSHYTPVITAIIPAVTTMLVVGYSW